MGETARLCGGAKVPQATRLFMLGEAFTSKPWIGSCEMVSHATTRMKPEFKKLDRLRLQELIEHDYMITVDIKFLLRK